MATKHAHQAVIADTAQIAALKATGETALQSGQFQKANECYEQLLVLEPSNPDTLCNLGILCYQAGNKERGLDLLSKASELAPQDATIRENVFTAHIGAAREHLFQNRFSEAVACVRVPLTIEPGNGNLRIDFTSMLDKSGERAVLSDFMAETTPDQLGTHIMLACMPKSGSTLMKEFLLDLTGWKDAKSTYAFVQNEQEIYLPTMLDIALENTVTQQHCRATAANTQIMQGFGIRPIVLIRHLPDIVLSMSAYSLRGHDRR